MGEEEEEQQEFLAKVERKFLTPVFQYKGASQFVMNIFRSVKKVGVQRAEMYCCNRVQ